MICVNFAEPEIAARAARCQYGRCRARVWVMLIRELPRWIGQAKISSLRVLQPAGQRSIHGSEPTA